MKKLGQHKTIFFLSAFLVVNIFTVFFLSHQEQSVIQTALSQHAVDTQDKFENIMTNYERSFQLFVEMMSQKIEHTADPNQIWDYLKSMDTRLQEIEGETFDGLYMYYQNRYLYSWDTPYSEYESTGYNAKERPWYQAAVKGQGDIVFTPPYMSYANHYILTTISQLQPDKETVFAYDIKMGDIQKLVTEMNQYDHEQIMIFDNNGTVIGSSNDLYLGGNFFITLDETNQLAVQAQNELDALNSTDKTAYDKALDQLNAAVAFSDFRHDFDSVFTELQNKHCQVKLGNIDNEKYFSYLLHEGNFNFLIMVPLSSILIATVNSWLVPWLIVEILLIYILGRIAKEQKNRELKNAYIEMGQIQKRLELALSAAQKAAAIDDLTGLMNLKSFHRGISEQIEAMDDDDCGILIMIDGDHFKQVNDTYGHSIGDEVIRMSAQMIIGRIRTVDLASRLHGDEFAIFIANTHDYSVAKKIMADINESLAKDAKRKNLPTITLSSGAVLVRKGDNYNTLSKTADAALYEAKKTHNGGFVAFDH